MDERLRQPATGVSSIGEHPKSERELAREDLIVTGTTLVRAAEACRKRGAVAVHAMATHGMFGPGAAEALASPLIDSLVITDTVPPERVDLGGARAKLSVLSIAPLLARAISALHHERSLTELRME